MKSPVTTTRGVRLRFGAAQQGLGWTVSAALALLILCPLAAVIIQVWFPGIFFGTLKLGQLDLLLDVFRRPLWRQSVINSVTLATGATALATLIGGPLAMLRATWSFRTAGWLDAAVWTLLIAPSFILAQGWVLFASSGGVARSILGWDGITSFVFTPFGLICIMALCKFPFVYLSVYTAMEWRVGSLEHAARLNGASAWTVWRTIRAPLLLPAYLAGAALVFMDTIGDFGLPASLAAVYRFPTLPYSIYSAIYTSPIRFDMAGVLSFYLVLLIALAMFLQFAALKRGRYDFLSGRAEAAQPKKPSRVIGGWLTAGNVAFLALVIGVPFGTNLLVSLTGSMSGSFALSDLTLGNYAALFTQRNALFEGLRNSLLIAGTTALISLVLGFLVAYVLIFSTFRYKRALDSFTLVSLAVPGVVLGIGYIFVWNQAWLDRFNLVLYGTPWILVLASVAGAIPIITRVLVGAMTKVPSSLLHAASMLGAGWLLRTKDILLPLVRGALLSAALAAFGSSVFDLAITSILYPPNFVTLPVEINKGFEYLQFGYATAATITGGGIVVGIIIIIERLLKRKERKA
ncbi:iron ABC transporter permease [Paenibacillus sp. TRM 82003]|nr:iron ABC transporter permease [Paenibacillus sp. TRM 82003]